MSDGEDGAVLEVSLDGGLDELVRVDVDGRSGFVEDENPGPSEKSSSQTQELPLSDTFLSRAEKIISMLLTIKLKIVDQIKFKIVSLSRYVSITFAMTN